MTFAVSLSYGQLVVKNNQGTEVMRMTNDGKLGIGISTPAQTLDVFGGAKISDLAGDGNGWVRVDSEGNLFRSDYIPGATITIEGAFVDDPQTSLSPKGETMTVSTAYAYCPVDADGVQLEAVGCGFELINRVTTWFKGTIDPLTRYIDPKRTWTDDNIGWKNTIGKSGDATKCWARHKLSTTGTSIDKITSSTMQYRALARCTKP
jgi:hypothetical protein